MPCPHWLAVPGCRLAGVSLPRPAPAGNPFYHRDRGERGEKQAALLKKKQLGVLGVPRGESLLSPAPGFARTQPGYAVASPVSGS